MVAFSAKSQLLPELHPQPKFANWAKKYRTTYTTATSALEYKSESEEVTEHE